MANWPSVEVLPGAQECLSQLHGTVPLCIATNAVISHHQDIRRALERGNLSQYFDRVFCFKKNQPQFWQAVEVALRVPLRQIAMVGDSLEHDALAPQSFGVQSAWLAPNEAGKAAQHGVRRVATLQDFAQLVANAA
jgi:FMN phosphatase YigB (HAD superfamily)